MLCLSKKGTVYHQKVIFEKDIEASEDAAAFSGHFCTVVFATCEGCVAGADGGLCSHVIALFLVLEKYRTSSRAVLSLPRWWGPRQQNIDLQPIMNITVEKSRMDLLGENISCTLDDARSEHLRTLSVDDVDNLWDTLREDNPMRAILPSSISYVGSTFGETPSGSILAYQISSNDSLVCPSWTNVTSTAAGQHVFPDLPVSSRQKLPSPSFAWPIPVLDAQAVERRTQEQSKSKEWLEIHRYTLTAANFHKIDHCRHGQTGLQSTLFAGKNLSPVPAIQHGKMFEPVATREYLSVKKDQGKPVVVRPCGIVLDTDYRYIGASPDGMVFDKSTRPRYGLLEVKCPFTAYSRSWSVEEAAERDKNFCVQFSGGKLQLSHTHPYFSQIQGQLSVSNLKWCDLFVWVGPQTFFCSESHMIGSSGRIGCFHHCNVFMWSMQFPSFRQATSLLQLHVCSRQAAQALTVLH